jgi:hypothetical protein
MNSRKLVIERAALVGAGMLLATVFAAAAAAHGPNGGGFGGHGPGAAAGGPPPALSAGSFQHHHSDARPAPQLPPVPHLSSSRPGYTPPVTMPQPDWQKTLPQLPNYRAPYIKKVMPPVIQRYDSQPVLRSYDYEDRLSCTQAEVMLIRSGYNRISAFDCGGNSYGFLASRKGHSYEITMDARSGRVTRLSRRR